MHPCSHTYNAASSHSREKKINKKVRYVTTTIYITAEVGRATSTATVHLRRDLFARNGRCFYFLIFYY